MFRTISIVFTSISIYSRHSGAENSNKLVRSITRSRSTTSTLSWSSSCKSLLTSSSKSSSAWTEFQNDLSDDHGGMESGSHALTLGRLYAWEKKLYEEVKVEYESIDSMLYYFFMFRLLSNQTFLILVCIL